jgi:hypothetical protein
MEVLTFFWNVHLKSFLGCVQQFVNSMCQSSIYSINFTTFKYLAFGYYLLNLFVEVNFVDGNFPHGKGTLISPSWLVICKLHKVKEKCFSAMFGF